MSDIVAYMISCHARDVVRDETLERLAKTDWGVGAIVVLDESDDDRPQERQVRTARRLLERAANDDGAGFVLFLEDDLMFNAHLRHNLISWYPRLAAGPDGHLLGSLYDPGVFATEWDHERAFSIAHPDHVYGSQALLLSRATVRQALSGWDTVSGMQDIKISRLAAAVGPIHYHRPSLVQHVKTPSTWDGPQHWAEDYSPSWRAP